MPLKQYYECHQCHSEFLKQQMMNGKFCKRDCYNIMRKEKGTPYVKALKPILIREENVETKRTHPVPSQPKDTDDVIPFDSLTIDEVKLIIANLSDQLSAREIEIQNLTAIINKHEQIILPLKKLALTFVRGYEEIENLYSKPVDFVDPFKMCPGIGCSKKVEGDHIFCSDACAKSVLPKLGTMMMNDGRMISK
jgi:hypothetical protein